MEGETGPLALYLYGFAPRGLAAEALDLPGVDGGAGVRALASDDLVAVISEVLLAEFTGAQGEAHLSDVNWVGPRALRHERVVEAMLRRGPVFPARFATLFSSPASVVELMRKHHDAILAFLERVAGKEEWSVKGYLERSKATAAVTREAMAAEEERLAASPGKRFLERQRLTSQAGRRVTEWTGAAQAKLRRALEQVAVSVVERAVTAAAAGGPGEMVHNFAVLVAQGRVPALRSAVEAMNAEWVARGVTVQCTGPLPPYSFTPTLEGNE